MTDEEKALLAKLETLREAIENLRDDFQFVCRRLLIADASNEWRRSRMTHDGRDPDPMGTPELIWCMNWLRDNPGGRAKWHDWVVAGAGGWPNDEGVWPTAATKTESEVTP